ncbi:hypothetical protein BST95_01225 [Halioglobus japonicus]|uniref:Glycosyltransferase subfamily 4-like N-terminal domain-containing protein n=1 Tax=Halioglobus japonicus TaxID=930805 RepID=A0AAP8SLV9_9GAMM|nr:glycosyltransferase family 4 protein [Halioglobus japonicus]AQA17038.1 hypothetical protein BST95_01225 [Halioglobus japonicus]PLW84945.1 hypothetical protein C0029_15490 [Halioglobus japonicus]
MQDPRRENESAYRRFLRRIYYTKPGQLLWRAISSIISHPRSRVFIDKALSSEFARGKLPHGQCLVPTIEASSDLDRRAILLVLPFHGSDASSIYVDSICRQFVAQGYKIDTVIYGHNSWQPRSKLWDNAYYLRSGVDVTKLSESLTPTNINNLDALCGFDLIQFIASLVHLKRYEHCIVSYVYLSRVFEYLKPETSKILVSHDVFSDRNQRIFDSIGDNTAFFYSLDRNQEKKGLERADLTIAITNEEETFFRSELGITDTITLPYIPAESISINELKPRAGSPLILGYLASSHRPNVNAIRNFIAQIRKRCSYRLIVAGSVCGDLAGDRLPPEVTLLGFVDNVDQLYEQCHIVINPDTLVSGLKVKNVEALAHDKPLLTTRAASAGLDATSIFHLSQDSKALVALVEKIAECPEMLVEAHRDSRDLYKAYIKKFEGVDLVSTISGVVNRDAPAST